MSGTVDSSAAVAAPGSTGVTSVASPGWAVTNHGIITAGGNGVTGDALFTLTNSGVITAGDSGALIGGGSTVINSIVPLSCSASRIPLDSARPYQSVTR